METFEYGRGRRKKGWRRRATEAEGHWASFRPENRPMRRPSASGPPSIGRARARAGNGAIGSGAADASHAQFSAYSFRKRKKGKQSKEANGAEDKEEGTMEMERGWLSIRSIL